MSLVLALALALLLLLVEAGHLRPVARGWWVKSEGATRCRLWARTGALRWWKTGGRQDWLGVSVEGGGVDARTTRVTEVSWRVV